MSARLRSLRDPQVLVAVGLILLAVYAIRTSIGTTTVLVLAVVIPSIMLHEISHGVAALACGDDTARRAGRITLNPLRHVDPVGTLVLPVVLALSGLGAFGYAKPVPVNPARMRHPRNDAVLVSLAGPATNLILAGLSLAVIRFGLASGTGATMSDAIATFGLSSLPVGEQFLYLLGFLNVVLAVFNALPIPPLDGSILIERLLPASALPTWWQIRRYAMVGLLLLVLFDRGQILGRIFSPAERGWADLLSA